MKTDPGPTGDRTLQLYDSADLAFLRDAIRHFIEAEMPLSVVRSVVEDGGKVPSGHWDKVVALGWPGVAVPEALGGLGYGAVELAILAEEHGRLVQPGPLLSTAVFASIVAEEFMSDDAQALARQAAAGTRTGTWSVDCDSAQGALHISIDEADSGLSLRGTRRLVPDAETASDLLVDVADSESTALAIVPLAGPSAHSGAVIRRMHTLDLARNYCEITFADLPLEPWRVIRGPAAERARQRLLDLGTALQCAESVGAAARLLELTVDYAKQRQQFGRPIGSFQAIKHRLADMRIRTKSSDAAARYAAFAVATHQRDATVAVHIAKQWVGESASWVAGEAQQIHGGTGFTWAHDLHLYLRRIKANELTLGTPGWHASRLAVEYPELHR